MTLGRFIVFEGGEGTGKSTQIRALESFLKQQGRDVIVTWEPGGTPLGERIRHVLLDPTSAPMDAKCEALLYAAARAQHVNMVIRPALERGTIVLCDRYIDASKAYQGAGRSLGAKAIEDLNQWGTNGLLPDKVYLFDANPEQGLQRAKERNKGVLDRIEQESMDFHQQVRSAYLYFASIDPIRYKIVNSTQSIETITQIITKDVFDWLNKSI